MIVLSVQRSDVLLQTSRISGWIGRGDAARGSLIPPTSTFRSCRSTFDPSDAREQDFGFPKVTSFVWVTGAPKYLAGWHNKPWSLPPRN